MSELDTAAGPPPPSGSEALDEAAAIRAASLGIDDCPTEDVYVPEWKTTLHIKGLSGTERDAWEAATVRFDRNGKRLPPDLANLRAKLIARSVVDANGKRVYRDQDVLALGQKAATTLQPIFEVCQRLSKLTDEDVEELTGNSNGDRSAETGSGSPSVSISP